MLSVALASGWALSQFSFTFLFSSSTTSIEPERHTSVYLLKHPRAKAISTQLSELYPDLNIIFESFSSSAIVTGTQEDHDRFGQSLRKLLDQPAPSPVPNAKIEALINQLASQNPAPQLEPEPWNESLVHLADDYDVLLQQSVHDAYLELDSLGTDAFPYLLQYIDDDRFSRTLAHAVFFNMTVGDTCRELITGSVDFVAIYGFGPYGKSDACDYFKLKWKDDLNEWWRHNWNKSLLEMQIDCLEFKIKKAKQLGLDYGRAEKSLEEIRESNQPKTTSRRMVDTLLSLPHRQSNGR